VQGQVITPISPLSRLPLATLTLRALGRYTSPKGEKLFASQIKTWTWKFDTYHTEKAYR